MRNQLAATLLFIAAALMLSACKSSRTIALEGAGSTFAYPVMARWAHAYMKIHPNVQINYQSIGSGGGVEQVRVGTVDFGASDFPLTDTQLGTMPPVIQIPESAGPVCITYNLPELAQPLRLSGSTLASIYLGAIRNWQNEAIQADNPGVKLPNEPIVVVHRAETSGTTYAFTNYLSKASPTWRAKVGAGGNVEWPVGLGGKGNEGVTGQLSQSPGAIGYVELAYALENHLPVAAIENQAGNYVAPSTETTTAAIQAFHTQLMRDPRHLIVNPPVTAKHAYPISTLTFLVVPKDGKNVEQRQALKDFFKYVVTEGQRAAGRLDYAPLPEDVRQYDLQLLSQMMANGQPLK